MNSGRCAQMKELKLKIALQRTLETRLTTKLFSKSERCPLSPLMRDEAEAGWKMRTHNGVMTLCKTPGRQTIATFFAPG